MKPIYLFSLPRAGSTLVQRVLAQHPQVATSPEPWVLLPLLASLRKDGTILAHYNQSICSRALREYAQGMPHGMQSFHHAIKSFALLTYAEYQTSGEAYFLDKTPRYHIISRQIIETFGDEAKYVLLWRNPLAVVSSIVETFASGNWNLLRWKIDLFEGLMCLYDLYEEYPDQICLIRYEELIANNFDAWEVLFRHLDLDFDPSFIADIGATRMGGMGDPTGQVKYQTISKEPLVKWKCSFSSSIRQKWGKSYLEWIGEDRLKKMGYSMTSLCEELDDVPFSFMQTIRDTVYVSRDIIWSRIEPDAKRLGHLRRKQGMNNFLWS